MRQLLIILLIHTSFVVNAQDKILMSDFSKIIKCDVISVDDTAIYYRLPKKKDTTIHTINKSLTIGCVYEFLEGYIIGINGDSINCKIESLEPNRMGYKIPSTINYQITGSKVEHKYQSSEIKSLQVGSFHFDIVEWEISNNKGYKLMERMINGRIKFYKGFVRVSTAMTGYSPAMARHYDDAGASILMFGSTTNATLGYFIRYYIMKGDKSYRLEKADYLETLVILTLDCPGLDKHLLKQEHTIDDVPDIIKKYNREYNKSMGKKK